MWLGYDVDSVLTKKVQSSNGKNITMADSDNKDNAAAAAGASTTNEAEVPKFGECCGQGHIWSGTPTGSEIKLKSGMNAYLAETKGSTR
eukprot:jgi/Hompol1/3528/HPOL_006589-RA